MIIMSICRFYFSVLFLLKQVKDIKSFKDSKLIVVSTKSRTKIKVLSFCQLGITVGIRNVASQPLSKCLPAFRPCFLCRVMYLAHY